MIHIRKLRMTLWMFFHVSSGCQDQLSCTKLQFLVCAMNTPFQNSGIPKTNGAR